MHQPFVGTEAVAAGTLTRGQLRWRNSAVHPGVYLPNGAQLSVATNAAAAWLWTGRRGVITGRAAASLHGASWVDTDTPIEVIAEHTRRRPGVRVYEERIAADEICHIGELPVTTPARTALCIGRRLPRNTAVAHLDALAAATGLTAVEIIELAQRYGGTRGIRRARTAVGLMDAGAQSPKETWLRLALVDGGLPRPRTQIRVTDGRRTAFLDMGWEEPKVGLDYEGDHHRAQRSTYVSDIARYAMIERLGWLDLRVVAEHSTAFTISRVREAFRQRNFTPTSASGL